MILHFEIPIRGEIFQADIDLIFIIPESVASAQNVMDDETGPEDLRSVQRRAASTWSGEEIESTWKHSPMLKPNGFSSTGLPYSPDAPL